MVVISRVVVHIGLLPPPLTCALLLPKFKFDPTDEEEYLENEGTAD